MNLVHEVLEQISDFCQKKERFWLDESMVLPPEFETIRASQELSPTNNKTRGWFFLKDQDNLPRFQSRLNGVSVHHSLVFGT